MERSEVRGQPPAATLVCFALEDEARAFRSLTAGRPHVSVLLTGIGKRNAERVVKEYLAQHSPLAVLTCGFAGGLNPELKMGDVVFETTDASWKNQFTALGAKPIRFFCADRIATTVAEKAELRKATRADAVEMESAAVARLCHERGISCATVRVISDTATEDLPLNFNELAHPDLSLHYGKLAWAIAKAPGKIPALRRLQKSTQFAARNLADFLGKFV